jgi:hypothetical protein
MFLDRIVQGFAQLSCVRYAGQSRRPATYSGAARRPRVSQYMSVRLRKEFRQKPSPFRDENIEMFSGTPVAGFML